MEWISLSYYRESVMVTFLRMRVWVSSFWSTVAEPHSFPTQGGLLYGVWETLARHSVEVSSIRTTPHPQNPTTECERESSCCRRVFFVVSCWDLARSVWMWCFFVWFPTVVVVVVVPLFFGSLFPVDGTHTVLSCRSCGWYPIAVVVVVSDNGGALPRLGPRTIQ